MVLGHAAHITDLFNLVLGYSMEIPPLDMAAYKTMPSDITTILQAIDLLDAGQEEQTQVFAKELAGGVSLCTCGFDGSGAMAVLQQQHMTRSL